MQLGRKATSSMAMMIALFGGCVFAQEAYLLDFAPTGEAQIADTVSDDTDLSSNMNWLQGWWELEGSDGCQNADLDNWWRAAIGYMEIGDTGPVFDRGNPQFRLYDKGCDLEEVVDFGSGFNAHAVCNGEDDETLEGPASFYPDPANGLQVTSPLGDFTLSRCDEPIQKSSETFEEALQQEKVEVPAQAPPAYDDASTYANVTAGPWKVVPLDTVEPTNVLMPETQRTAIVKVYRDFCDPDLGNVYDLSGTADPNFYQAYKNQLFVAYGSQCLSFLDEQVLTPIGVQHVQRLISLPSGRTRLDADGALVLGLLLYFETHSGPKECWGDRGAEYLAQHHGDLSSQLLALATTDNLWSIGSGYGSGWGQWAVTTAQRGMPYCDAVGMTVETMIGLVASLSKNVVAKVRH